MLPRRASSVLFALSAALLTSSAPAIGDEIEVPALARVAPLEPNKALASFRVAGGFRLELAAADPLVVDPVALSFDEDGRLYVVEMRDYSERDRDRLGRVRRLEDTDGDGRFDHSTVFLEDLSWPTAVICSQGGVFVAAAPAILFAKDTDGDGRADERRTVFTGFGRDNVQGLLNSFVWGLDGRIYGATSSSGGRVRRFEQPESAAIDLRGRDFAFDPRSLELHAVTGGGQHGLAFDDWGRRFHCSNSDHIRQVLLEDELLGRNSWAQTPSLAASIAADGPQAEVFRASPVEPWRILRTRLRVAGAVPGPVEGGGRASGYFTSATGLTIYRGDAWPAETRGLAIVADVGSNLVHRKRLVDDGLRLRAERIDQESEFIASGDTWFRPVQFANGPDGALYIADMHREVVEHPASLPEPIKRQLDLNSGSDRGRIYRVVPEGFRRPPLPRLGAASTAELVAALDHPRSWQRDTAARLLLERGDPTAVPALRALWIAGKHAEARLQALWLLERFEALADEDLSAALGDPHPRIREQALRLAEPRLARSVELVARAAALVDDPDPQVRLELALRLAGAPAEIRTPVLARLAVRDAHEPLVRFAVQSSVADSAAELLTRLMGDAAFCVRPEAPELIGSLARQVGGQRRQAELEALVAACQTALPEVAAAAVAGAAAGLARSGAGWRETWEQLGPAAAALLERQVERAHAILADRGQSTDQRLRALEVLVILDDPGRLQGLLSLLDPAQPDELRRAVLAAVGRAHGRPAFTAVARLDPAARAPLFDVVLSYPTMTAELAQALADKQLPWGELSAAHRQRLRAHPDARVRAAVDPLVGAEQEERAALVARYRAALELEGNVDRGRAVFRAHCAACHRLEQVGHEIGPPLAAIKARGAEAILLAVLEPNREVNPQYVSYTVATVDGRVLTGMIAGESSASLVLRRAEGQEDTVARRDVESMTSAGQSLMPEGLEQQIDLPAMADLLTYLAHVE